MPTSASSSVNESRAPLQDDIYDIDEGNEADTEDNDAVNHTTSAQLDTNISQEETTSQTNDSSTIVNSTYAIIYLLTQS